MPIGGLKGALHAHEANTGSLPYSPIKLGKSGDKVKVRILAHGDVPTDPETQQPIYEDGKRYIFSLYFHRKFGVLDEVCLVDEDTADRQVRTLPCQSTAHG